MAQLSYISEAEAKKALSKIFAAAGVGTSFSGVNDVSPSDAEPIVNEIIDRKFLFFKEKLDEHLTAIGALASMPHSKALAQAIAWFCSMQGIVWDDQYRTPQEVEAYKDTTLGGALYKFGCFASSPEPLLVNAPAEAATAPAPASAASAAKGPAGTGYKSWGPQSGNIPNLISYAGKKGYITGTVFAVEADKIGKNTPNAYITPLKADPGATSSRKVSMSDAKHVSMGSGNGYTDCKLWFENSADADKLVVYLNSQPKITSKFNNIHVVKYNPDKNGYYKVAIDGGTIGEAWIKASKLNECIGESLEECGEQNCATQEEAEPEEVYESFKITDIDLYDYWSHRSNS